MSTDSVPRHRKRPSGAQGGKAIPQESASRPTIAWAKDVAGLPGLDDALAACHEEWRRTRSIERPLRVLQRYFAPTWATFPSPLPAALQGPLSGPVGPFDDAALIRAIKENAWSAAIAYLEEMWGSQKSENRLPDAQPHAYVYAVVSDEVKSWPVEEEPDDWSDPENLRMTPAGDCITVTLAIPVHDISGSDALLQAAHEALDRVWSPSVERQLWPRPADKDDRRHTTLADHMELRRAFHEWQQQPGRHSREAFCAAVADGKVVKLRRWPKPPSPHGVKKALHAARFLWPAKDVLSPVHEFSISGTDVATEIGT